MGSLEPAALFQHPAVQYIPIGVEELWFSPSPTPSGHITLTITDGPGGIGGAGAAGASGHLSSPARYGTPATPGSPDDYIHFIANGVRVMQCHYRAHQAILVGQPTPGHTQSFRLTRRYFYKPHVSFDLFDWQAQPLATVSARIK